MGRKGGRAGPGWGRDALTTAGRMPALRGLIDGTLTQERLSEIEEFDAVPRTAPCHRHRCAGVPAVEVPDVRPLNASIASTATASSMAPHKTHLCRSDHGRSSGRPVYSDRKSTR